MNASAITGAATKIRLPLILERKRKSEDVVLEASSAATGAEILAELAAAIGAARSGGAAAYLVRDGSSFPACVDGSAKGGVAIPIVYEFGLPVKLVGVGRDSTT